MISIWIPPYHNIWVTAVSPTWRRCETGTGMWKHRGGVLWWRATLCFCADNRQWKQAALQSCEGCEGFMWLWLCTVLWCGEVWWGWALPTERLRRRRETVVSPVVDADRVRPPKSTTPGRSRQGPSTAAWPLWKPPAYYVITSYWAL